MKHLLTWNDYLKTGIEIVDEQHRGLLDLTNETAEKINANQTLSLEEMRTFLGYLTDYAATHFSTEEALMALGGIDEKHLQHHRESHANFLHQVNAMVGELDAHSLTGQQITEFLGHWLIYHILGEDQQLTDMLRGTPQAAPEKTPELSAAAQEAATQSLAKLYAFMAERNQHLQARQQSYRDQSHQMAELVARQDQALAVSEERFRALFHNGKLAALMAALDPEMKPARIIEANPAACELLGYDEARLLEMDIRAVVAADEFPRFPLLMRELQVAGRFECEMNLLGQDGQRLPTQVALTQCMAHGQPVVMFLIEAVSSRRAAQLERHATQAQALHLAEVRSRYLAGMPEHYGIETPSPAHADVQAAPASITQFLAEQPLFQALAANDLNTLKKAAQIRRLQKGETLFRKGDKPTGLVLVLRGNILLAVSSPQGERKVMGIHDAGHSIGEAEVVMDSPYPYFAEAVEEAEVLIVAQSALLALLDKDKQFARRLISCMGSRQHELMYSVESFTLRTGTERVIGYLLQHARVQANGRLVTKLPATKQLIASLLHIKPETLSRIFRDLSDTGLILGRGRQMQIPDIDRLVGYQG
ncbi:MAG: PAS domain S-box protein [Rhodocyclales bacterium GT-UBC]|nr:MAG: PAS domain S-box protein [Rhodocyclales bacterium GT-UBC]